MRHHRLSIVPTSTACATALRAQTRPALRPALADALLTMLVAFPEDARLVGVIFGDVVVLFNSFPSDDAGDLYGMPSRPRVLGH
jgi:hypothetical protein